MPAFNNVVLTDRAATPVAHTFVPQQIVGGTAFLAESTGSPVSDNRLSISWNTSQSGRKKVVAKLVLPIVQNETINGVTTPKAVRVAYAEIRVDFDANSTEAERNNTMGMLSSLCKATEVVPNDTFVKLQGIY